MIHYEFELKGRRPLLMHKDDVMWSDHLEEWQKDPANANLSKKGDDRTPAWRWHGYLYTDGQHVAYPFENLMSCLAAAGARVILKGKKTYKEMTQTNIRFDSEFVDFFADGKKIPLSAVKALYSHPFRDQFEEVKKLNFLLFVKRARVGQAKHIRVRPRFNTWNMRGTFTTTGEELSPEIVRTIWDIAGSIGLSDWRPGSPRSPGPFGMFDAVLKKIK